MEEAWEKRMRGDELPPPEHADSALAKAILKACAYRPGDRYESASAFAQALQEALSPDPEALFQQALRYTKGDGVPVDERRAFELYSQAAQLGHAAAQNMLGFCCSFGKGTPEDKAEAAKWYRLAAEQGLAKAQYSIGCCCDSGDGVPRDQAEAVKWYRLAAQQDYAPGQYNPGLSLCYGTGVKEDAEEGLKWIGRAAKNGYSEAKEFLDKYARWGRFW